MDILHLVDRLEELFNESKPIWFTHSVIVDEDRMLDLIDQMRVTIPEEIKKSQQLLAQRDRILAQAQEEASRTIALAREKQKRSSRRTTFQLPPRPKQKKSLLRRKLRAKKPGWKLTNMFYKHLLKLDEGI